MRVLFFIRDEKQWYRESDGEYGPFDSFGEAKAYRARAMKPSADVQGRSGEHATSKDLS